MVVLSPTMDAVKETGVTSAMSLADVLTGTAATGIAWTKNVATVALGSTQIAAKPILVNAAAAVAAVVAGWIREEVG